jgi:hypothetical protein
MELDPGIHIVMHSVLSLKPGVTRAPQISEQREEGRGKGRRKQPRVNT